MISKATRNKHKKEVESLTKAKRYAEEKMQDTQRDLQIKSSKLDKADLLIGTIMNILTKTPYQPRFETKRNTGKLTATYTLSEGYDIVENLKNVATAVAELKADYARENEAADTMQEQIDSLIKIIRIQGGDQTLGMEAKAKIDEAAKLLDLRTKGDSRGRFDDMPMRNY